MSDTPRTDAEADRSYTDKSPTIVAYLRMGRLARCLERELTAARAMISPDHDSHDETTCDELP